MSLNPPSPASSKKVYLVGALIIYLTCVFLSANMSTIFKVRLFYGFIFGTMTAVIPGLMHLVLQAIARRVLRRFTSLSPRTEILALNLPVTLFCIWMVATSLHANRRSAVFERALERPVPPSVQELTLHGGMVNFAEPPKVAFRLKIDAKDLQALIEDGGFVPVTDTQTNRVTSEWMSMTTGVKFDLTPPYNASVRRPAKGGEQNLFFASNNPVVYLFAH